MGAVNLRFVKTTHGIVMGSVSHLISLPIDLYVPRGDVIRKRLISSPITQQPLVDQGLLIIVAVQSHSETQYTLGPLWTGDQPDAETPT